VVVADLKGPGVITMIHFALPQLALDPQQKYRLGRELVLRMYWDDEKEPSVDCPMVDFFGDPAGMREQVNTALVNKRRGYNAYFPMPFRKSARILLIYEGDEGPGRKLWSMMPAYSYVMWRASSEVPSDQGYFHAQWRTRTLLSGKEDYTAMEAFGRGKFIGWNVTVRRPGTPAYPVDMNEKFYVDGEASPSVEFQGIEDSFGFSWGFPESESIFPLTGYWPFMQGACAYRLFINDANNFDKSLRVAIKKKKKEDKSFFEQFSQPGTQLQYSSTSYWYQTEPHQPFPPLPALADRAPAPEQLFWPDKIEPPKPQSLRDRGVSLHMLCGRPESEVVFAEPGFSAKVVSGAAWAAWTPPVYHCRSDVKEVVIEVAVPPKAEGTLRVYVIDPDNFMGGRRQQMHMAERDLGEIRDFQAGRWLETHITPELSESGKVLIRARNLNSRGNATVSIVEWVGTS
jgi:hypothetical protein